MNKYFPTNKLTAMAFALVLFSAASTNVASGQSAPWLPGATPQLGGAIANTPYPVQNGYVATPHSPVHVSYATTYSAPMVIFGQQTRPRVVTLNPNQARVASSESVYTNENYFPQYVVTQPTAVTTLGAAWPSQGATYLGGYVLQPIWHSGNSRDANVKTIYYVNYSGNR